MMKKQVLSIEQMKYLRQEGINTSKASMYWTYPKSPEYKTKLSIVGEHGNLNAWEQNDHGIGAFTLHDLLNILPCHIDGYILGFNQDYRGQDNDLCFMSYTSIDIPDEHLKVVDISTGGILRASYDMLIWAIKNKYINLENTDKS